MGWIVLQRNFNQVLFYPPSVAGWPSGQEWIDSTSLVKRMQLPSALVGLDLTLEDLPEIDASDPFKNFDRKRVLRGASILSGTVEFDTSTLIERFDLLVDYLLGGKINSALRRNIYNQFQNIPNLLKTKRLFSTLAPEFQMT